MKLINQVNPVQSRNNILLLISFSLCLLIFALYWQTLNHEFVFDDSLYVENPVVSQGLSLKGLSWAFSLSGKDTTYFHPLSWLSHMRDVEIYGLKPAGHHLNNLILHCCNTLLLFWIFSSLTKNITASTIVALLFAIHPINIETVAWVTERKNLLSTFFGFCTILAYKRYADTKTPTRYLAVCFLFLLSLLAKPALAILPILLFLLDFWPLARVKLGKNAAPKLMKLVLEKIPLLILSVASVLVASASLAMHDNMHSVSEVSLQLRIANALVSPVKYIIKLVFPFGQSVFYPFPHSVPVTQWAGSLLLLGLASFLCLKLLKKQPYFFFGWFWFLIAQLPVSGLLQAGLWPAFADRWAYVPVIGLFVIFAWPAEKMFRSAGKQMRICLAFCGLVATIFLMAVTNNQIKTWQNSLSLFKQAIIYAPDHYVINNNYASALLENNRIEEAIKYFQRAISFDPGSGKEYRFHFALGDAYEKAKDYENASIEYAAAIKLNPDFIEAYNSLSIVLAEQGKIGEAVALLQRALKLKPDDRIVRQNLLYAEKLLQNK
jgi:hypothetical protein